MTRLISAIFVNLFLMLMNFDKNNMTAQEVAERQQEKIMMMGPILYRLQTEFLDPLVFSCYLALLWIISYSRLPRNKLRRPSYKG